VKEVREGSKVGNHYQRGILKVTIKEVVKEKYELKMGVEDVRKREGETI